MAYTLPSEGLRKWPSLTSFFQRGTSPNEVVYAAGVQNQSGFTTATLPLNSLRGSIFSISRQCVLSKLFMECTSNSAGSVARCGIYATSWNAGSLYPTSLVVDSGQLDTSAIAVVSVSVSATLYPGTYWYVAISGTAIPTFRAKQAVNVEHTLGSTNTLNSLSTLIVVARTFGALPTTFPASAALSTGNQFVVGMEFSG